MNWSSRLSARALRHAALAALLGVLAVAGHAQEPAEASAPVRVQSLQVSPEDVGAQTLCQLRAFVRNDSDRVVDALGFAVRVAGQALDVYETQLFLDAIDPGETKEIRLFNFWSSETGRELPRQGPLVVEVQLLEAQFVTLATQKETDEKGREIEVLVWEPQGAVPGLPHAARVELEVKR